METLSANVVGKARRVREGGRDYLVVPASMIPHGVMNGSQGPLYYPLDEQKRSGHLWDGQPIVVRHPTDNQGRHISARSQGVLEKYGIGLVRRPFVKNKTAAEAWFDEDRTRTYDKKYGTDIIGKLQRGEPVELSTGLFTDNEHCPGVCPATGRFYSHVARNYRPDHLALLPDEKGACSVADGCGFNVNQLVDADGDPALRDLFADLSGLGLTDNVEGQVRSKVTGWFKRYGAGSGKGPAHDGAQKGNMVLTDAQRERGKDARVQAEAGQNPPSWAVDEATWERAKAAADKGGYDGDSYYAVVTHIYERMGGEIAPSATTNESNPDQPTLNDEELFMFDRAKAVAELTANCDCWKGQEAVLNAMSDDQLAKVHKYEDERRKLVNDLQGKLATNAAPPPPPPAEEKTCPDCGGAMKGGKCDCGAVANKLGDDQFKAIEARILKNLGFESVQQAQATLNSAREVELTERRKLVSELVGNIADEGARKTRAAKLLKQPLADLRERVDDLRSALAANRRESLPGGGGDDWVPDYAGDRTVYAPGGAAFPLTQLTDNEQSDFLPDPHQAAAEVDKIMPVTANASTRLMQVLGRTAAK